MCRYALLLTLYVGLAGCGFQLQSRLAWPESIAVLAIDTDDRQSPFARSLSEALRGAGARIDGTGGRALRVRIERDELLERVASVSARNQPREYELTYVVRYSVMRDGVYLVEAEEVTATRDFSFDERLALAKARELEQLRETLARELAGVVLQRIASLD
jgi:outer membrane lipopolysaccharide assembly protein LptE/RlpB